MPFFRHDLGKAELEEVQKVLSGPILTTGQTVEEFERRFADYLGRRHAVATTSCTGSLHLCLLALGIGPGDEVITTPMTFVATVLAILEAGARPVFVDVEEDTGNMDAARVEKAITQKTKAIIPVHLYGLMCDMAELRRIADNHGLYLIEDAAHCVEGKRDGISPGELSQAACFSFYATKAITCGEGGAIVTDGDFMSRELRLLRLHGMTKTAYDRHKEGYQHWDVTKPGWKYNLDNIKAALLFPQLDRLNQNLEKRHDLARYYEKGLSEMEGVRMPAARPAAVHARHLFPIWVRAEIRDEVIRRFSEEGIETVVNYRPVHLMTYFSETFGFHRQDFPIAERIGDETISLPFYPNMPKEHADAVIRHLGKIMRDFN